MRVSRRPQNYLSRVKERVGRGCIASAQELSVGGRRSVLEGACRVGPGIIRRGRRSVSDGNGCVGPGMIRRGQRSVSDGAGCINPGIIRRGRRSVSGRAGCVCGGWRGRRLWIARRKVTLRRPRNYPLGPTETRWTGTLLGALLTAVTGEYKYRLPRRALPEVRYL